jgi:hypothetical protein
MVETYGNPQCFKSYNTDKNWLTCMELVLILSVQQMYTYCTSICSTSNGEFSSVILNSDLFFIIVYRVSINHPRN